MLKISYNILNAFDKALGPSKQAESCKCYLHMLQFSTCFITYLIMFVSISYIITTYHIKNKMLKHK